MEITRGTVPRVVVLSGERVSPSEVFAQRSRFPPPRSRRSIVFRFRVNGARTAPARVYAHAFVRLLRSSVCFVGPRARSECQQNKSYG
jgi:hypothetical protein